MYICVTYYLGRTCSRLVPLKAAKMPFTDAGTKVTLTVSKETSSDLVSLFLAVSKESFCHYDAVESEGGGGGHVHRSESDDGCVRFPVVFMIWAF